MRTTDLMIGDWIEINHNSRKVKVTAVFNNLIDTTSVSPIMGDEVSPIFLTHEMLRANGFEIHNEVNGYILPTSKAHAFKLSWDKMFCDLYWNAARIRYVHELQHALRLCGLTELADNFKVEE